jgi:DNA-binding CsgD family transcriptional regulator
MAREELWDIDCAVLLRQYAWACLQFGEIAQAHGLIARALTFPLDSSRLRIFAAQAAMLIGLRMLDDALIAHVDDPALLTEALEPGNESTLIAALAFAERDLIFGRTVEGREALHRVVRAYAGVKQPRDDDGAFVLVAQYGSDEDATVAREFVQRFRDETGAPVAKAHLLLYDCVMAGRRGDREAAKRFAGDAFDIYHALGWRWHEARALEFSGKLKEAMRAYDVAGDARSTQRLHEALNPVNRRGRAASDLTETEAKVARLAADGKTNREIADALTLSSRTVETHMGKILGKLSLTRTELIAKWRDLAPEGGQVSSRSRRS